MLLLYTHTETPRLRYVVDFIGKELFADGIEITTDEAFFRHSTLPRINYSSHPVADHEFFMHSTDILFENYIKPQPIGCFEAYGHKAFFRTGGDFAFDVLAASFYLISRYEEYLPHQTDMYGRYAHTGSLAFKEGFIHLPLVNIWLGELRRELHRKFPELLFRQARFACALSYDIDMAYAYRYKGIIRNTGGFARSLLNGNWYEAIERWEVLSGKRRDPFDCFEWLDALHLYCRLQPYYFFLVAKTQRGYDKNISTRVKAFQSLIEYYAGSYKIGLHPSWQSGDDEEMLKDEHDWLEAVADRAIVRSRQHYLRFNLPHTYRRLVNLGIGKEFSMGYGTINGFRASVCSSFYWYDLEKNEATGLRVYPFCFMDSTSFYQQEDTPGKAYAELVQYYEQVKKLNGLFISVWHNSLLGGSKPFQGWREMFELFMKEMVYWDAYSG